MTMKFQKLTIHNIASVEDAVVDFEAEPLRSSEVFLITGKTGAGKSTILDCICLALFDSTPRLSSTKMEGDVKDSVDSDIKVKDVRQLMRRNTAEAFVCLTFTGSNGISYEATWSVARARKKLGGKIQKREWQLENLATGHTLTKIKEVEAEISNAIGLDFSQFCRTTMLAQGEFTRFLNSNDNDKAAILEKITGVDIYSKVGAKIYDITARKRQEWSDAQKEVDGVVCLTAEEIAARHERQTELERKQQEIKAKKGLLSVKQEWIRKDLDMASAVAKATEELAKAKAVVESEAFRHKEKAVADWNATADARRWLSDADAAAGEIAAQQAAIDRLQTDYAAVAGGMEYAKREVAGINAEINSVCQYLEREKAKAAVYENCQAITSQLDIIIDGRRIITDRVAEIAACGKRLAETLMPAYEKAFKAHDGAKEELQRQETKAEELEKDLTRLNLAQLRRQRDEAKDQLVKISQAKERLDALADALAKKEQMRQSLALRLAAINENKKKSDGMQMPIHDAQLRMEVCREGLEKQKATVDGLVKTLRLKLHVGDTCPVCRQRVSAEMPHEDELEALVAGLQQAYDAAEKKFNDLTNGKTTLDAGIKVAAEAYENDMKTFSADASVDKAEKKAAEACLACGIDASDEKAASLLESEETTIKKRQGELDARIAEGEKMEKAVSAQRKAIDNMRKGLETLYNTVKSVENAINACNTEINKAKAVVLSKTEDIINAEGSVGRLVCGVAWDVNWREQPKEFRDALASDANIYINKVERKKQLTVSLSALSTQCQNVDSVIRGIIEAMPAWSAVKPSRVAKSDSLLVDANSVSSSLTVAQTRLNAANKKRQENMQKLADFLDGSEGVGIDWLKALGSYSPDVINGYMTDAKREQENVVAKKSLLDEAKEQRAKHQTAKPELLADDTPERLSAAIAESDALLDSISQEKGGIIQELKTDADNKLRLGALIKVADEKQGVYQKWHRLSDMIGDATGGKFRKIAQSYVLTSLIHSANAYMRTLSDRYMLKVEPGSFVISLEDAYQGYASRAATTISGGESFLVSLSLALALSDIGQQWQVDTLFIDEGFGTLSGEPLQRAVETLRSLHSRSGRHVGIISHVEELKERIPVQIQVNQEGHNSSSRICVVDSSSL